LARTLQIDYFIGQNWCGRKVVAHILTNSVSPAVERHGRHRCSWRWPRRQALVCSWAITRIDPWKLDDTRRAAAALAAALARRRCRGRNYRGWLGFLPGLWSYPTVKPRWPISSAPIFQWDVLSVLEPVFLRRELSSYEQQRLADAVADPVIRARISEVGLGEYAGAAGHIADALHLGATGTGTGHLHHPAGRHRGRIVRPQ
jgi:hypothetical protein